MASDGARNEALICISWTFCMPKRLWALKRDNWEELQLSQEGNGGWTGLRIISRKANNKLNDTPGTISIFNVTRLVS